MTSYEAVEVHGDLDPTFDPVRGAVQEQLGTGAEVGVSLVVDLDGERVVDLWGGHRDASRTQAWTQDTVTNVWSLTKTVTSLAALLLVEAGELDVDAPVARYWPEFAAQDKGEVLVRHLMSHTSGVAGLDKPSRLEDLYDARGAAARMAAQTPWWAPGTASGYHLLNYGHLLGELVYRITGQSLREFVQQRLSGPVAADFQIGLADGDLDRVADVIAPTVDFDAEILDHDSPAYKTLTGPMVAGSDANTAAWRAAEIGAANGHGNARSIADVLAPITHGGHSAAGRLLSPRTIDLIFQQQSDGVDLVNGLQLRWGIGFALADRRTLSWLPEGQVAFWGGWGGSMAILDLDRRMTISYVMNNMGTDILGSDRAAAYVHAAYAAADAVSTAL
jgi:CubicO group peptidase (beta-lactamase class C family)